MRSLRLKGGFTLLEVIVVVAIISTLAALLLPTLAAVRERARQTVCLSNLRQIGVGTAMYQQDNDGFYPYAVDPVDRLTSVWVTVPEFSKVAPQLPWIQDVLQPYVRSKSVFCCPDDSGFQFADFSPALTDVYPSSYEKYGTSYYYRTELAAFNVHESRIQTPESINMFYDGVGSWHGTLVPLAQRYNVLFVDGHAKNVSRAQLDKAWATPLSGVSSS